jgi:hypothetical protein
MESSIKDGGVAKLDLLYRDRKKLEAWLMRVQLHFAFDTRPIRVWIQKFNRFKIGRRRTFRKSGIHSRGKDDPTSGAEMVCGGLRNNVPEICSDNWIG